MRIAGKNTYIFRNKKKRKKSREEKNRRTHTRTHTTTHRKINVVQKKSLRPRYLWSWHTYYEEALISIMAIYTIERESGKTEKESETGETHIVFTFPHLTHKCWNICCDSIRFSVHSVPFPLCISFSCRPALSLSLGIWVIFRFAFSIFAEQPIWKVQSLCS